MSKFPASRFALVLVVVSWYYGADGCRPGNEQAHTSAGLIGSIKNTRIAQVMHRASTRLNLITDVRRVDATRATFVEFGARGSSRVNDAAKPHATASTQHQNQISTLSKTSSNACERVVQHSRQGSKSLHLERPPRSLDSSTMAGQERVRTRRLFFPSQWSSIKPTRMMAACLLTLVVPRDSSVKRLERRSWIT